MNKYLVITLISLINLFANANALDGSPNVSSSNSATKVKVSHYFKVVCAEDEDKLNNELIRTDYVLSVSAPTAFEFQLAESLHHSKICVTVETSN